MASLYESDYLFADNDDMSVGSASMGFNGLMRPSGFVVKRNSLADAYYQHLLAGTNMIPASCNTVCPTTLKSVETDIKNLKEKHDKITSGINAILNHLKAAVTTTPNPLAAAIIPELERMAKP